MRPPLPTRPLAAALIVAAGTASGAAGARAQEQEGAPRDTVEAEARQDTLEVPPPTAVHPLEALRVTVTRVETNLLRVPFAVAALDAEAFQAGERGVSLEESLRAVPGVTVHDRRNFALGDRLSVRGSGARAQFGVRGVRVLLDGIPLTMPDGQTPLTALDPASLGRGEIVRGPAAALYGNAAGGVLAFHTREPEAGTAGGEPRLLLGSHGLIEARAAAGGRRGELGWRLSGSRLETDGFRDHARARVWRTNALLRARPAPGARLSGVFHLYHAPFAENPGSLSLEDATERPRTARSFLVAQGAGETATQAQGGIAAEARVGSGLRVGGAAWGAGRSLWNPIPDRIIDLDRLAGGVRVELAGGSPSGTVGLGWTTGIEVERQRDLRRESENLGVPSEGGGGEGSEGDRAREGDPLLDQRETVLGIGPFAQLRLAPSDRLELTVAARWDGHRFGADDRLLTDGDDSGTRTMSRLSPAVGVAFLATPGVSLFANLATAFQTPTTSELSNRPDGEGGFDPGLGPERTLGLEVGARGALVRDRRDTGDAERQGPRLQFDVAVWRARVSDALVPFEGPSEETFFRNAGESDRTGVEVGVGWRPASPLELRLAYAWQRFRFDEFVTEEGDFSGRAEPGVPEHDLFLSAVGRGPGPLRSEIDLRWTDAFPVDDANTARNPSYRVVDLRFSRDGATGRIRPFLGVNNLLGERYNGSVVPNAFGGRYYEPAPGFEVYGGISLALGGPARGR